MQGGVRICVGSSENCSLIRSFKESVRILCQAASSWQWWTMSWYLDYMAWNNWRRCGHQRTPKHKMVKQWSWLISLVCSATCWTAAQHLGFFFLSTACWWTPFWFYHVTSCDFHDKFPMPLPVSMQLIDCELLLIFLPVVTNFDVEASSCML